MIFDDQQKIIFDKTEMTLNEMISLGFTSKPTVLKKISNGQTPQEIASFYETTLLIKVIYNRKEVKVLDLIVQKILDPRLYFSGISHNRNPQMLVNAFAEKDLDKIKEKQNFVKKTKKREVVRVKKKSETHKGKILDTEVLFDGQKTTVRKLIEENKINKDKIAYLIRKGYTIQESVSQYDSTYKKGLITKENPNCIECYEKSVYIEKVSLLEHSINSFFSYYKLNKKYNYNFESVLNAFILEYFGNLTLAFLVESFNSKKSIRKNIIISDDLNRFWVKNDYLGNYTNYELNLFNIVNYFIYFQGNIMLVANKTNKNIDDIFSCLKYPKMKTIFQPFVTDKLEEYLKFSCLFTKRDALKANKISLSVLASFLKNNGNLMETMAETGYPITIIRYVLNSSYITIQSDDKTRAFITESLSSQKELPDDLVESISIDMIYERKSLEQACLSAKISVPYFYSNILPEIKLFNQARYVMILDLLNRQKIINEENRCRELIDTKEE